MSSALPEHEFPCRFISQNELNMLKHSFCPIVVASEFVWLFALERIMAFIQMNIRQYRSGSCSTSYTGITAKNEHEYIFNIRAS